MIKVGTKIVISDNSSAREARCIKILKKEAGYASVGDTIIVSIQRVVTKHSITKIQAGEVHRAVVVETRAPWMRADGTEMRWDRNAVVLINAQGLPLSTRIIGVIPYELRAQGFMKLLSLCAHVI